MSDPSAGCQTCKIRRIKCDGAKPTCLKCAKSRRFCLDRNAAANQAIFSIHVENCYASGEAKRPRGPRSSLTLLRPHCDLPSRALSYFLNYHLQTLNDTPYVLGCLSESVSAWRISARSCTMVDLALSSLALAVFSRTQHYPQAAIEASSRYCRLLRVAQGRIAQVGISTCDDRNIDACLLAVLLMGRYEGAMHQSAVIDCKTPFTSPKTWSHHDGALAILKFWSANPFHGSPTCIIRETRRGLIRFSILRDISLPDWILDGNRFGEHGLELDYDRIMVRIVKLRIAFASLRQQRCMQIEIAEELDREARELDEAWRQWAAQTPKTWSYQLHTLTEPGPWPKKHFYSSIVYSYARPAYTAVWSQYFAARMLISSTHLKLLELICHSGLLIHLTNEKQRLECISQLKAMADSLASTIPSGLGKFQVDHHSSRNRKISITLNADEEIKPYLASWTMWPLAVASSLEGIDVMQQLWFRSELATVGKVLGDGVLSGAETNQWATI